VLATPAVRALAQKMKIDISKVTPTGKGGKVTQEDVMKFAEQKSTPTPPAAEHRGEVLAAPAVRALAQKMKIDISKVIPTGKGGKTTQEDVLKYAEQQAAPQKPAPTKAPKPPKVQIGTSTQVLPGDQSFKIAGIQYEMAKSMTLAQLVPHYSVQEDISAETIKKIQKEYERLNPKKKMGSLPLFIKAFSIALNEFPVFNSIVNPAKDAEGFIYEYIKKADHNIGISIEVPNGVIYPNLKAVQNKSIIQISEELADLTERARKGALAPEESTGATFSITNMGVVGAQTVFGQQIAIAAVGPMEKVPVFTKIKDKEYSVKINDKFTVSMSMDHRIVDGATGANFIGRVREIVENMDTLISDLK
jgi:2-oxoisovalerate dehydrogenase E2 component (dihydrolipoyl transacylase)